MAQHGGRTAQLARAHRPRAPIMSAPAPLTAPLAPLRPAAHPLQIPTTATTTTTTTATTPPVTLTAPRPDTERTTNEYVETPFRSTLPPTVAEKAPTPVPRFERPIRVSVPNSSGLHTLQQGGTTITKQPIAFTKEHPSIGTPGECASSGNIICQQCGRCKCESCKQPKALPQRWVCDNNCLCSADALIDYVSCLCCVKGLYYHCSESDTGTTCADDPCSCGPSKRFARWGCLSALAAVLPCLLCYWPLRGCQRAVEAAYARHSRAGCRCPPRPHANTPEKRLLDSSPDF